MLVKDSIQLKLQKSRVTFNTFYMLHGSKYEKITKSKEEKQITGTLTRERKKKRKRRKERMKKKMRESIEQVI